LNTLDTDRRQDLPVVAGQGGGELHGDLQREDLRPPGSYDVIVYIEAMPQSSRAQRSGANDV
jgi:hypothetical protein